MPVAKKEEQAVACNFYLIASMVLLRFKCVSKPWYLQNQGTLITLKSTNHIPSIPFGWNLDFSIFCEQVAVNQNFIIC